jgi:hypothetical protein
LNLQGPKEFLMPILVKFMLRHALVGYAAAIIFVAAILALDLGGLATLVSTSRFGVLAVAMLTFFTGLTFASLQMGIAVMSLKDEAGADGPADHGNGVEDLSFEPVPVRVRKP